MWLGWMAHQRESGMAHCRSHLVKEFDNLGHSHETIHVTFHYRTYNRWGLDGQSLSTLEAEGIVVPELIEEAYTIGFDSGPSARTWSSRHNNNFKFVVTAPTQVRDRHDRGRQSNARQRS